MSPLERYQAVRQRMDKAIAAAGRPADSVTLIGVSKRHPAESIRALYQTGLHAFGENYLQEALGKQQQLADLAIEWHFIGHVQSNKTRDIASHFAWVHGVTTEKVMRRLDEQRPRELPPLNVCIEVNIDGEQTKSGLAPDAVLALARYTTSLSHVKFRGLMAIPAPRDNYASQLAALQQLAGLADTLRQHGIDTDTLSMGMSDDLEAAIAAGATHVRIGTALFGPRPSS